MTAYIKRIKDFKTVAYAPAIKWNAPLYSNDNSAGSITFPVDSQIKQGYEGYWLIMDGHIWVIQSISPSDTEISVSVVDAFNAFNRNHVIPSGYTKTGAFLADMFNYNYKGQSDAEYAMPYLNVVNNDATTALIKPVKVDEIFYNANDYLRRVSQKGVKIDFVPSNEELKITIYKRSTAASNIILNDSHSELISQQYSQDITSKVSVVKGASTTAYYLHADGTFSQTAPSPRILGLWEMIKVDDGATSEDIQEELKEIFSKNDASYKIEFYSDRKLDYCSKANIRIDKEVKNVIISSVSISSDDDRYRYTAGDLATTMTAKLKKLIKEASKK